MIEELNKSFERQIEGIERENKAEVNRLEKEKADLKEDHQKRERELLKRISELEGERKDLSIQI